MEKSDFIKSIYSEANTVYLSFVSYRFQVLGLFILNAAVFHFLFDKMENQKLVILVALLTIGFTWIVYLIDKRNRYIFRRAVRIANEIENHFDIPIELRLHEKSEAESKKLLTHTNLILLSTILITVFWMIILIFPQIIK